jgi:hypothetical protein
MKTHPLARIAIPAATLLCATLHGGCRCEDGPVLRTARAGGEGGASNAGRGGTGGSGALDAGPPGGSAGSAGGSGRACGGPQGLACTLEEYCNYPASAPCGASGDPGICHRRPEICAQDCPGVCGCDGVIYCNACMTHAAGTDTAQNGWCALPSSCDALAHALSERTGGFQMCTTIVRLDYESRALKSYRTVCAPPYIPAEGSARIRAQSDTGFGEKGKLISGSSPQDELVFWEAPADVGGAGVVSARNGASVLGGGIVSGGEGHITYPVAFQSVVSLGSGCLAKAPQPPARGFDLRDGKPLSASDTGAALGAVWSTALPDGIAESAEILDAMALLYPPAVSPFEPAAAEWVVLVNSGPQ